MIKNSEAIAVGGIKSKLKLKTIPTKSRFLENPQSQTNIQSTKNINDYSSSENEEAFYEKYEILEQIGQGANGVVFTCRHKKSDKIFAVKRSKCDIENMHHLKSSYNHTKRLHHEGVIHYKGLYIIPQKRVSYLVMEYFQHPDLLKSQISDKEQISNIAYQILEAVAYLHMEGVCHRDIKPDNILYDRKNRKVKLTDFGESKEVKSGRFVKQMMTCTGTLQYKAPQLFRGGIYDELIDEWAVGVTIYQLLTGRKPFHSDYNATIIDNIENCRMTFDEQFWSTHPLKWAKKLLEQLLCPRQVRISASSALKNLWFKGNARGFNSIVISKNAEWNKDVIQNFPLTFESWVNETGQIQKKSAKDKKKKLLSQIKRASSQIIMDQYASDDNDEINEEQLIQKPNFQDKKQFTTSSTQCKSPYQAQDEECLMDNQFESEIQKRLENFNGQQTSQH